MRSMTRFVVVASFLAIAGLGLSAVQAADRSRLPTRNRPRIRSRAKAKISGDIRCTTASGGTGCLRTGGCTGAITDGTITIPRLSLHPIPPVLLRPAERIDLWESSR